MVSKALAQASALVAIEDARQKLVHLCLQAESVGVHRRTLMEVLRLDQTQCDRFLREDRP